MGCDIHMFVEVHNKETGKWEYQHKKFPNPYYDLNKVRSDWFESIPEMTDEPYFGRNYALFSILADVRNVWGLTPISPPRGVPENASEEYIQNVNEWYGDGHSHSYFTLGELKDFDWSQTIENYTYAEFAKDFLDTTIPRLERLGDDEDVRIVFFFDN